MNESTTSLLDQWLSRQLDAQANAWLAERRDALRANYTDQALHITLGLIPRKLGKDDLDLDEKDLDAATSVRDGWHPQGWSVSDAARVLVLVETAACGNEAFAARFAELCRTADVSELIAFYRGLSLYPDPHELEKQAGEGLRSNMRSVFEAVALANPFPHETFDEARWNHMVLKALFVESPLSPIQGLDERANAELATMLCDYAHERWAASRPVSHELWRCVGPYATGSLFDDLVRVLEQGTNTERRAAALALTVSPDSRAASALASAGDLRAQINSGELTWANVASSES